MVGLCYKRSILNVNFSFDNYFSYKARLNATMILLWVKWIYKYVWNGFYIYNSKKNRVEISANYTQMYGIVFF